MSSVPFSFASLTKNKYNRVDASSTTTPKESTALVVKSYEEVVDMAIDTLSNAMGCDICGKTITDKTYLMCAPIEDARSGKVLKANHGAHVMCSECRWDDDEPWIGDKNNCLTCLKQYTLRNDLKNIKALSIPVCVGALTTVGKELASMKLEVSKIKTEEQKQQLASQADNRHTAVADPEARREMQVERGHVFPSDEPATNNATTMVPVAEESENKKRKKKQLTPEAQAEATRLANNTRAENKEKKKKADEAKDKELVDLRARVKELDSTATGTTATDAMPMDVDTTVDAKDVKPSKDTRIEELEGVINAYKSQAADLETQIDTLRNKQPSQSKAVKVAFQFVFEKYGEEAQQELRARMQEATAASK